MDCAEGGETSEGDRRGMGDQDAALQTGEGEGGRETRDEMQPPFDHSPSLCISIPSPERPQAVDTWCEAAEGRAGMLVQGAAHAPILVRMAGTERELIHGQAAGASTARAPGDVQEGTRRSMTIATPRARLPELQWASDGSRRRTGSEEMQRAGSRGDGGRSGGSGTGRKRQGTADKMPMSPALEKWNTDDIAISPLAGVADGLSLDAERLPRARASGATSVSTSDDDTTLKMHSKSRGGPGQASSFRVSTSTPPYHHSPPLTVRLSKVTAAAVSADTATATAAAASERWDEARIGAPRPALVL